MLELSMDGRDQPKIKSVEEMIGRFTGELTILMNPFMSCGARLPVYVLFAAAFFPANGQNLVFALYLIGIAMAILTGLIMKLSLVVRRKQRFPDGIADLSHPYLQRCQLENLGSG